MQIVPACNLACPIDSLPLVASTRGYACANGHSYDRAREGYGNVLVVQHKASLDPGDSKEMVQARRRFLECGAYAPIAGSVYESVRACAAGVTAEAFNVADAGCGEGYYLDRLAAEAKASPAAGTLTLTGFDVSKWAVRAAARRTSGVTWLVANNRHPPFVPGSVDMILCLFGFPVWEGFRSVQRSGGHVLLVDPGPDHLIQLREIIYPEVKRAEPAAREAAIAAGYELQQEDRLRFDVHLPSPAAIADLLAMTPHAHRIGEAGRSALTARQSLAVTADVRVRRRSYRR
jgi:23S rRNA (guanine745-N1)-methyltransferase